MAEVNLIYKSNSFFFIYLNSGIVFSSRWKKNSPIKDSVEGKNEKSSCFVIIWHKISLCNAHLPSTLTSFLALELELNHLDPDSMTQAQLQGQ